MATFIMFGKYSSDAVKQMSSDRTEKANNIIRKFGGEIKSMYALLGEKDLVFIVDFPDVESALKASVGISRLTGIGFTTSPAVSVDKFDKMMTEV